jgi:hypothetical protein
MMVGAEKVLFWVLEALAVEYASISYREVKATRCYLLYIERIVDLRSSHTKNSMAVTCYFAREYSHLPWRFARSAPRLCCPLPRSRSRRPTALAEILALIFELRPESLETEGLVSALTKQAETLQARHKIVVSTELRDESDLPMRAKTLSENSGGLFSLSWRNLFPLPHLSEELRKKHLKPEPGFMLESLHLSWEEAEASRLKIKAFVLSWTICLPNRQVPIEESESRSTFSRKDFHASPLISRKESHAYL